MQPFSFSDVLKEAGIKDIDYVNKSVLASEDIIFCVTNVERVEVINSKFDANEQWRLTILCALSTGDSREFYVSFPYESKRRDPKIVAVENKLKELAQTNQPQIVHSLHIVAKQQTKYDQPYYKLEDITVDGKSVCSCQLIQLSTPITAS